MTRAACGSACSGSGHAIYPGHAGIIQLVECQLPKLDVAGSSPVARSLRHGDREHVEQ